MRQFLYRVREMERDHQSLALEVLGRFKDGNFLEWANLNLGKTELYPWAPTEILPEREDLGISAIIEVVGPPSAGKSTGVEFLRQELREVRAIILPELELPDPFGGTITRRELLIARELGLDHESALLQELKLAIFWHGFDESMRLMKKDAERKQLGPPILTVNERGPNDVVAFSYWAASLALHKQELPLGFVEDVLDGWVAAGAIDWNRFLFPGSGRKFLGVFLQGLACSQIVDAVVLYGVSRKTVLRRRKKAGLLTDSPMLEPRNWSLLEAGYGWWLGSIYPLLRERCGTGLLVINGERSLKENNQILLEYCRKVVNL